MTTGAKSTRTTPSAPAIPSAPAPGARGGLRDFYEDPAVPVASGTPRSLRQARMLAAALGPATAGARTVLDIGCGDGTAAATAAPFLAGHRVVGVDWSQDALRRARTRVPYAIRGELADGGLPFAKETADAVLFSEVVEHLVDPDGALDEIRRVLRPGGHLMLSTPNLAAWYNRGLLLAGCPARLLRGEPARRPRPSGAGGRRPSAALHGPRTAGVRDRLRLRGRPARGRALPRRTASAARAGPAGLCRAVLSSILLLHARRT